MWSWESMLTSQELVSHLLNGRFEPKRFRSFWKPLTVTTYDAISVDSGLTCDIKTIPGFKINLINLKHVLCYPANLAQIPQLLKGIVPRGTRTKFFKKSSTVKYWFNYIRSQHFWWEELWGHQSKLKIEPICGFSKCL